MGLSLNILSSGAQPGRETRFAMSGEAMTLGRAESNDVVLPDPTREISSAHAVLQFRNGDYLIIDTSTNGTFLNGDPQPLGDLPTPLNHGDILRIGAYELQVHIDQAAQNSDPFADLPPPVGEEPIVEQQRPQSVDDIIGIDTGGGDFLDDLLGQAPPNAARMETRSPVDADDSSIDEFLDVAPDPNRQGGASAANHSNPMQDHFDTGGASGGIPDDWDDDFLSGIGGGSASPGPERAGSSAGGGGMIPETSFSDEPFEIPKADTPPAAPPVVPDPPAAGSDPIDDLLNARADSGFDVDPADLPDPTPEAELPEPTPAPEADAAPPPQDAAPGPAPEPAPPEPAAPAPAAAERPAAPASAAEAGPVTGQDLARRFLTAAGVDADSIDDAELGEVMDRAGAAFRTLVEGAREVLMARAQVKDELQLGQTMISADGNNPIKFSVSPQQAMDAMIKPTVAGYKPGDEAAREAMRDIKAHEVAMVSGMETALKSLLTRFNPQALGDTIEKSGVLGGLLRNKKAQYWDAFEKLYAQISEDAEEDFNALFGKSFSKAYKDQMVRLKSEEKD